MTGTTKAYKSSLTVKFVSIFLTVALLVGVLPQVALAAPAPSLLQTCAKYHTVASGDTVSSISVTYDVSITEIATANNLKEPYTLFVGQRLCIPGSATTTTTGSTSTSDSKKTGFTVERQGNNLVITATNYPKKSNFYVKLKKGRVSSSEPWVKLGILRTKKNSEITKTFKLPKSFYNTAQFQVCLKNAKSDALSCQSFTSPIATNTGK